MSLNLHSTLPELDEFMRSLDSDANVNAGEFKLLRDAADDRLKQVSTVDVEAFRATADELVEAMQKLALAARKGKLSPQERKNLMDGVEHQLGYVIAGYQSSVQRL